MTDEKEKSMTRREKTAIRLILLAVRILSPWQYDHKYRDLIASIEAEL